uniref:Uncharacterized protein n=1 Tax=viral metagenome TaxID=1070528 RepID=A0A6M3LP86_9ZZZZ
MSLHFGPRHIAAVNAEHLGRLARFAPEDNAPSWWTDRASADYRLAALLFVAPFGDLTEAHIAADPLAFDHALREWRVCDKCKAAQLAEGRVKGDHGPQGTDCTLEKAILRWQRIDDKGQDIYIYDESLAGTRNWYLDIVQRADHTWHWAKRRCADKLRRQQLIEDRVRGWEMVGGMQAREVEA